MLTVLEFPAIVKNRTKHRRLTMFNFEIENFEFLVTESFYETSICVEEHAEETLWAFQPDFLASHMASEVDAKAIEKIQLMYEDVNPILKALIVDWDHFIQDAIAVDGAGHFLNPYDGEEWNYEDVLEATELSQRELEVQLKVFTEENISNLRFYQQ